MGEGGAIIINNEKYIEWAEILCEKGTEHLKFFRGENDKYSWGYCFFLSSKWN